MSQVRSPWLFSQASTAGYSTARVSITFAESVDEGYSKARAAQVFAESVDEGYSTARSSYVFSESVDEGFSKARVALMVLDTIFPAPPEERMATAIFPGFGNSPTTPSLPQALDQAARLKGVTFNVHKKPQFKTKISEAAAGQEIRNMLAQYPRWQFDLPFEYLEDRVGANSSLRQVLGFYLGMGGPAQTWLFKDPDDYAATNSLCGTSDGGTLQFPFMRTLGGYGEPVGQVDTANTINVYLSPFENQTVPVTPGPYTVTVTHSAGFVEDLGVTRGGVALTKVASGPAANQYSVAAGVYTFNSAQQGQAVVINYRYLTTPVTDWSVVMPNQLLMAVAPPANCKVSADFQFFFTCRFLDDEVDFEKFMDKLWTLQTLSFRSVLL